MILAELEVTPQRPYPSSLPWRSLSKIMSTHEYKLSAPPEDSRSKELWLQHTAGKIYFEDAREYAINQISDDIDPIVKEKIIEGINNTMYGLMMILDGVSGSLENEDFIVSLQTKVLLSKKGQGGDEEILEQLDLFEDGDGMCMGYHDWIDGGFGEDEVATKK